MVITGAISFGLTPVVIRALGDFHYGMWTLAGSLVDSYGLLDTGLRVTMQRFVARLNGKGERAALNEILATVLALMTLVSLLVCGITAILAISVPRFFELSESSGSLFRWLVILFGLSMAAVLPTRALGTYLAGLQRFDLYNLGAIITMGGRAISVVIVLHLGFGVLALATVNLATAFASLVLHWRLVRWADPRVTIRWRHASWSRARSLAKFSLYTYLGTVGDHFRFFLDSIVIGRFLSISLITPFSAASRLMEYFRAGIVGFASPLMPRMSELDGNSATEELRQLYLNSTRLAALLSFLIGSLLVLNGESILRVWLGERFAHSYPLLVVMTSGYVVALAQLPSAHLMVASGRHRPLGLLTIAEGLANITLSIYWARYYGLIGVALGTAVPMLAVSLLAQPSYALRILGLSKRSYVRSALARPLVVVAIFFLTSWLAVGFAKDETLVALVFTCAWQISFFGILAYFVGLSGAERRLLRRRTSHFFHWQQASS